MSRLEERLEKDLARIRAELAKQAEQASTAVKDAVRALQTGDKALAYQTVLNDHPVNRAMRRIDRMCHGFIAVHLPSAGHLRFLSAAIRVNIELERIGDYAVTIAREAAQLSAPPNGSMAREIERMTGESLLMLRQASRAFNELNGEMARSTMVIAEPMEHNLDEVYEELMSNAERDRIKEILAVFVVFTQLKRVADQAKNICEETVFAVTGSQKAAKVYNILFIDRENSCLSRLAEAIARHSYPKAGHYRSAGSEPAAALSQDLLAFMDKRGLKVELSAPTALSQITEQELAEQHVVVSLDAPVETYLPKIPFHTSAMHWDLGPAPADHPERIEEVYRDIALRVRDLIELLRGEE